jgi:ABC-type nitrate/sulfonate/bicarbonate transport system ATPase subunit
LLRLRQCQHTSWPRPNRVEGGAHRPTQNPGNSAVSVDRDRGGFCVFKQQAGGKGPPTSFSKNRRCAKNISLTEISYNVRVLAIGGRTNDEKRKSANRPFGLTSVIASKRGLGRMDGVRLQISNLHSGYATPDRGLVPTVDGVDLALNRNEFVSIIGPSGCGKSTLFNVIAGLLSPTSGEVALDGKAIVGRPGHVAYMMQRDLLLPWRTILDNVVLGPELAGKPMEAARNRAAALLRRFGLEGYENSYPSSLSGGMRQRAALLRTILCDRSVVLLDEPFGALDALTRATMHEWLLGIQREFQQTMILITHDPDEAIYLSDRVYVATPRPMRFAGIVPIELPYDRGRDVTMTPQFADHKRQVLALLRGDKGALDALH